MSEALYRKYRPQIFEDVVGQEHIERTIKNAIEQDKVSHAYLFCGPRGTGKTTTARLLAKALLCEHGPTAEPDGTCEDCRMIAAGEHPDVYELDAASRTGVENVREEIIGRVQFAPTRGRYKIYIIDEVHMLSTAAFNALLKTLEEPPSHVVFILATTDPQKVPETILSRCQRFDFRRISNEAIVSRLGAVCVSEGVEFEGDALDLIAHRADGGMRNALTSLEQLIAFGEGSVTLEVAERMLGGVDVNDLAQIVQAIGQRDVAGCFRWVAEFVESGADLAQFAQDLAARVRNLYVMSLTDADVALDVAAAERRELVAELPLFGPERLARLLGVLGDLMADLKTSTNARLSFEIALTRMVRPDSDVTIEALAERVEALERGHSAVAHVTIVGTGAPAAVGAAPAAVPGAAQSAAVPAAPATAQVPVSPVAPAPAGAPASPVAAPSPAVSKPVAAPAPAVAAAPAPAPVASAAAAPAPAVPASAPASAAPAPAAPAPAPAAAAASGSLSPQLAASLQNPASLQRVWKEALASLKRAKAAYGVLFLNTKAVFDGNGLRVEFPAENAFAFKAVQKQDVQDAVADALTQACGERIPFAYTQAGKGGTPVAPMRTAAQPASRPAAPVTAPRPATPAAAAPQPAPRPAAPAASAPAQRPAAPARAAGPVAAPAPDDFDRVPLDAYDSFAPSGAYDDYAPIEPPAPASRPAASTAPAPTPMPATPAAASVPAPAAPVPASAAPAPRPAAPAPAAPAASGASSLPPEPDARTSASIDAAQPALSSDDLQAMLAAGFGSGVVVEEVRE